VLEAMAARCMVVASALDGHLAASGGHAQLFPVGDHRALADSLIAALGEVEAPGDTRRDALERAFAYANERSFAGLARHYETIYLNALG
jgi:hypothetical protein